MLINPMDPAHHGKPLWVVYGPTCFPSIVCAKLFAYTAEHVLLPVGQAGPNVCIWGYSVHKRVPGFRTLGLDVNKWSARDKPAPRFYTDQGEALADLQRITTPKEDRKSK